MSTQIGTWNITVKTPTGSQGFDLRIEEGPIGFVIEPGSSAVQLDSITLDENGGVVFQNLTLKPMKLKMSWDLLVEGDEISGTVKPGVFPAQKVFGTRA